MDTERLSEIGKFLSTARPLFLSTFNKIPQPGSQADIDFTTDLYTFKEPEKVWPIKALKDPRNLAANLIQQSATHLDALGLLYQAEMLEDVPGTVARAAFEYMSRAVWILDPNVDHKARCARLELMNLKSFDEKRKALKISCPEEQRQELSNEMSRVRKCALKSLAERYGDLVYPPKSDIPKIADESYLSFTDVAEHFGSTVGMTQSGRELYDLLALWAHPQGFSGFNGVPVEDEDGVTRRPISENNLVKLAGGSAIFFYKSLSCLLAYHGDTNNELLEGWLARAEFLFPGSTI